MNNNIPNEALAINLARDNCRREIEIKRARFLVLADLDREAALMGAEAEAHRLNNCHDAALLVLTGRDPSVDIHSVWFREGHYIDQLQTKNDEFHRAAGMALSHSMQFWFHKHDPATKAIMIDVAHFDAIEEDKRYA